MKFGKDEIDNVDQRIAKDVDKMIQSFTNLLPEILIVPFLIIFYWIKCYQISRWIGPLSCLILFVIFSLINYFLIQIVSRYVYAQQKSEGDFRFQHLRVRNQSESIAFIRFDLFGFLFFILGLNMVSIVFQW